MTQGGSRERERKKERGGEGEGEGEARVVPAGVVQRDMMSKACLRAYSDV